MQVQRKHFVHHLPLATRAKAPAHNGDHRLVAAVVLNEVRWNGRKGGMQRVQAHSEYGDVDAQPDLLDI